MKAAAATSLAAIFENVGNTIYMLGYAVETAKLNTLISNLSTPAAQQALETIGATDWFVQLKTTRDEFGKGYKTKVETESAIDYPLVKDARDRITKYLRALLSYIGTNSDLDAAKYAATKEKINEIITDSVSIARVRSTRNENADKKTDKA